MHTPHLEDLGTRNSCVDVAGEFVESVDAFDDRDIETSDCQNGIRSGSKAEVCKLEKVSKVVL